MSLASVLMTRALLLLVGCIDVNVVSVGVLCVSVVIDYVLDGVDVDVIVGAFAVYGVVIWVDIVDGQVIDFVVSMCDVVLMSLRFVFDICTGSIAHFIGVVVLWYCALLLLLLLLDRLLSCMMLV